nr:MAG TPA: hypothetical protein [Caudoviricetes sp.]
MAIGPRSFCQLLAACMSGCLGAPCTTVLMPAWLAPSWTPGWAMRTGASLRARLVVLQTGVNGRADLCGLPEQRGKAPFKP